MTEIFHLAERSDWDAAQMSGSYEISTWGRTLDDEGFIHCSLWHQVQGIADTLFADRSEVVLLTIDSSRLTAPVRYEIPEPGAEPYPHIYGPIPVTAVVTVRPLTRDSHGRLVIVSSSDRTAGSAGQDSTS